MYKQSIKILPKSNTVSVSDHALFLTIFSHTRKTCRSFREHQGIHFKNIEISGLYYCLHNYRYNCMCIIYLSSISRFKRGDAWCIFMQIYFSKSYLGGLKQPLKTIYFSNSWQTNKKKRQFDCKIIGVFFVSGKNVAFKARLLAFLEIWTTSWQFYQNLPQYFNSAFVYLSCCPATGLNLLSRVNRLYLIK